MYSQHVQVRDMTQIFISRAQLLPAGETIEDHKRWQKDEADIVEKDKKNNTQRGGLFAGRFKRFRHHNASAIRDVEDGVDRCPMCAWELGEDGRCTSCAFDFDSGYPLSDSASLSVSEDLTEDDDVTYFMGDELDVFDTIDPDTMSSLERRANRSLIHRGNLNHRLSPRMLTEVETRLPDRIQRTDHHARRFGFRPGLERLHFRSITDDESGDTDDDTSEEDDLGSLRDFIVEDGETQDGNPMQLSPRSSHYDSDEASGIFEALGSYSADEQVDDQENDVSQENATHDTRPGSGGISPNIISIEDYDSDEGPVLRSRARGYRRSIASLDFNGTAGDEVLPVTRRRRNTRESRRQDSGSSTLLLPERSSQTSTVSISSSTASRAISIESGSDSGSSPLVRCPRTRQRRSASSRVISDEEDDAATVSSGNTSAVSHQSSSGTMTIGRRSPARLDPGNHGDLATVGPSIAISSSPGRLNALP